MRTPIPTFPLIGEGVEPLCLGRLKGLMPLSLRIMRFSAYILWGRPLRSWGAHPISLQLCWRSFNSLFFSLQVLHAVSAFFADSLSYIMSIFKIKILTVWFYSYFLKYWSVVRKLLSVWRMFFYFNFNHTQKAIFFWIPQTLKLIFGLILPGHIYFFGTWRVQRSFYYLLQVSLLSKD